MSMYPPPPASDPPASKSGDDFGFGLSLDGSSLPSSPPPSSSWANTMGGTLEPVAPAPASLMGMALTSPSSLDEYDHSPVDIDDDSLDASTMLEDTSLDLVEKALVEQQVGGRDTIRDAAAEDKSKRMRHSLSMPEMTEVCAMRDFDDAVCALKGGTTGEDEEKPDREVGHEADASSSPFMANSRSETVGPKQLEARPAASSLTTGRMRRCQSFSGFTGLSHMATTRFNSSASSGFSPAFGTIDERAPIMWKRHDPKALPRRSSLKSNRNSSMTSAASTASFASSVSYSSDDAQEGDLSSPAAAAPPPMKRNVSFSSLEIYEHEVTLGDNPSVTAGPPVTLEWTPHAYESHDLDEYEEARADLRRDKRQMQMSDNVRFFRLMRERGFTALQIKKAVDEVQKAKQKRRDTVTGLKAARLEEALESAERKVKRFFKVGKRSNKV